MDLSRLLSLQYYFTPLPDPNFRFAAFFIGLGILLILIGIFLQIYRRKFLKDEILKKILKRYPRFFNIFGILIILLTLIRIAGIQYLSMRVFWVIYGLLFLYYAFTRLMPFKGEYRERVQRLHSNVQKKRYLPHKKP